MKRIKIFLASSNELENERRQFEIEIYRKTKRWFNKGIFLHLAVCEDLSARLSSTGSQSEYNNYIKEADIFVLLAFSKLGMYTAEEFQTAFGQFKATQKPFIYTYFKEIKEGENDTLPAFKKELSNLKHFYSNYTTFDNLWVQFNKELDRLYTNDFSKHSETVNQLEEKNVVKKDIKNVRHIKIGDKNNSNSDDYKRKNIVEGNIENSDEFRLGDEN